MKLPAAFAWSTVILAAAVVLLGFYAFGNEAKDDLTAAFAHDLAEYVTDHHGDLPRNWMAFSRWMQAEKHSDRWKAAALDQRFVIHLHRVRPQSEVPEYIQVTNSSLLRMQPFINRCIHYSGNS